MDEILQKYYENRMSMMSSDAWQDLMEDVQTMFNATNDVSAIQDDKTLHFRRGEISIMRWLLNLKTMSESSYQQLKDENAGS
jgi:hypothetical protein